MVETRFHSLLRRKIEEQIQSQRESMSLGGCVDYAAYRFSVGYLQGLADALKIGREIEAEDV